MTKKVITTFALSIILVALFAFSYSYFSEYSPKVLKKVNEVKGLSSIYTDDVPYPKDAVKIGANQTPTSRQTTFRTSKSVQEVTDFYINSYSEKRWISVTEKIEDGTAILSFRKDEERVNIVITSEDESHTIVSIEKIQE
jgi:hypothetical protein